jgi:hypothetical protein
MTYDKSLALYCMRLSLLQRDITNVKAALKNSFLGLTPWVVQQSVELFHFLSQCPGNKRK